MGRARGRQVEPPAQQLGRRLRDLGLTQGELGERVGVTDGAVSRWISGERRPSLDAAFKLQRVLGIPADAWRDAPAKTGTDD